MRIFHNLIHVQRDNTEEVSASGIVIPESVDREIARIYRGVILGVGCGCGIQRDDGSHVEIPLNKGDRILFRMSGFSKLRDGTYFVPYESVYALLETPEDEKLV